MLILASTDKLQLVQTAAVAVHVQVSWVDLTLATGATAPGRANLIPTTAVTTDIVASPASGVVRNVKHVSVHAVGGANTVTLQHTDGSVVVNIQNAALLADESLLFNDGTGIQVLDSTGAVKQAAQPSAGRYLKTTVYATAGGSGNHTTDAKASTIVFRALGGGGGGGGCTTTTSAAACGAGGGSGGYIEKSVAVLPSTAYAYAVGIAGTAGANTGGTGGTGGVTTLAIAGTTYTASGGVGGAGQTAGTTAGVTAGGAGGAATGADVNVPGAKGYSGNRQSGTAGWSGDGANSPLGGGGIGLYAAGAGGAATGFGAGGAGGLVLNGSTAVVGGVGTGGLLVVDEYT